jgi:hypothetical protein
MLRWFSLLSGLLVLVVDVAVVSGQQSHELSLQVELTPHVVPIADATIPLEPFVDFEKIIREQGGTGVLDPNSIELWDEMTRQPVAFQVSSDLDHGDQGRLAWTMRGNRAGRFRVRFRSVPQRPMRVPAAIQPAVGIGDLLRFNAGTDRPLALPYPARLVDLTGDGRADLVGCWNYAYRPGEPWDGIWCFPRLESAPGQSMFRFGDPVRLRYVDAPESDKFNHFQHTYMWCDVADFDGDGLVDLVWVPARDAKLHFFRQTARRDAGGMPVFVAAGTVPRQTTTWEACRAVDLDADGCIDIFLGDEWLRGQSTDRCPPQLAPPRKLDLPGARGWFDVDGDRRLDALARIDKPGPGLANYDLVWHRQLPGSTLQFGEAQPLLGLENALEQPMQITAFEDGGRQGVLVSHYPNQTATFYEAVPGGRWAVAGLAVSPNPVISLGDQAWPHGCDWDADGDLDLLVGNGYGWIQLVRNQGTRTAPRWALPERVEAGGNPIRLTRDELLGGENWHDMGYTYPAFLDWDGDGLPDLLVPNETNRFFWYRNVGKLSEPRFGERRQLDCLSQPDSPEGRRQSAARAGDSKSNNGVYPYEPEQPFFWRTGAAFADWNGDGRLDLITHDGHLRQATLFVQSPRASSAEGVERVGPVTLRDGRMLSDAIVARRAHWRESFRPVDWDRDGLVDLLYSLAGAHAGIQDGGSIYLLRNVGSASKPRFDLPVTLRCYGEPIRITNHGPHPWAGDWDGDGLPDLLACVEWSVYPFYSHMAIQLSDPPRVLEKPD